MTEQNRPTTAKQKILITLIVITGLLLFISLVSFDTGQTPVDDTGVDRGKCLERGGVWDEEADTCYNSTAQNVNQTL